FLFIGVRSERERERETVITTTTTITTSSLKLQKKGTQPVHGCWFQPVRNPHVHVRRHVGTTLLCSIPHHLQFIYRLNKL
ncbi:hypothetical protein B296_00047919, partial [Ensete ventricosum]